MTAALAIPQAVLAGEHKGEKQTCTAKSCPAPKASAKKTVKEVDTKEVKALIEKEASLLIFDARGGKYDDGKRIAHAKALPADASKEAILKAAGEDKSVKILTYCSNLQCPASRMLANRLKKLGYNNLYKYPAGIEGWQEAGHKVRETK